MRLQVVSLVFGHVKDASPFRIHIRDVRQITSLKMLSTFDWIIAVNRWMAPLVLFPLVVDSTVNLREARA